MGNHRFKLSNIIPNSLFFKLKQIAISTNPNLKSQPTTTPSKTHHFSSNFPRKSPNHKTHFTEPPRKSSKRRLLHRRTAVMSSISGSRSLSLPDYSASSSDSSCYNCVDEDSFPPEFRFDSVLATDWSTSCGGKATSDDGGIDDDIIIDIDKKSLILDNLDPPPITIKNSKISKNHLKRENGHQGSTLSIKISKEHKPNNSNSVKKLPLDSPRRRVRVKSPKIEGKRKVQCGGKSVSSSRSPRTSTIYESFAVVKSTVDPKEDFRESMVEMIVENNIRASKDLEDLLACYLSLNGDEYHHLIINVFKQVWFDFTQTPSM